MEDYTIGYKQFIFANSFIFANRLQTACEKIQTDITIKQWLLLALVAHIDQEKNLTNIGNIMGCSRQNVKKLATPLEDKGYLKIAKGTNNSLSLELTDKFDEYQKSMTTRHLETLNLLFSELDDSEIEKLFDISQKLNSGLEKVEEFGESL